MRAPVIALVLQSHPREGRPALLGQNRAYFSALEAAGAVPVAIAPVLGVDGLRRIHERCDGLLLPGGSDVSPSEYGEAVEEGCGVESDRALDCAELQLLRWALEEDRPVLGLCRGLQLLNVCCGGTLWQDLGRQRPPEGEVVVHRPPGAGERFDLHHDMELVEGSRLRRVLGVGHVEVNSFHHQGIRELGTGLVVSGRSRDGLIEAVEMPGRRYVVAVQSHPEELCASPGWARRLFSSFMAAAGGG